MARPARKQREIDETRQAILAAAASVFATRGFEHATMKDIATAAEYSAPALYSYFAGKQAILDALVVQIIEDVPGLYTLELPANLSLPQRVELLLRHQSAWLAKHRDFLVFSAHHISPPARLKPPARSAVTDIGAQLAAHLTSWLRKNSTHEERHGRDPAVLAMMLSGMLHASFQRWIRHGGRGSQNDDLAAMLDVFFHGVFGG